MTTPKTQRMVGPDLARGMTLLGIALANSVTTWAMTSSRTHSVGNVRPDHLMDSIAVMFSTIAVHVRGLPMFATLLGYGVGLIYARCAREGMSYRGAQKTILRRYLFLGLFGALHMIFLFYGDIMLMYAMLTMLLIPLMRLSDKILLWIAGGLALIGIPIAMAFNYFGYINGFHHPASAAGPLASDLGLIPYDAYVDQVLFGVMGTIVIPFQMLPLSPAILPVIIIGFVAGRRNILANPTQFRKPMLITMAISAIIALGVGIPWGISVITGSGTELTWWAINGGLGFYTGPGTVAMFFYLGDKLAGTKWVTMPPLSWVVALGRMSMSGYVLQSVVFTIIMTPWGLGIGSNGPISQVLALAVCFWFVTVLWAGFWPKDRGPLEILHRKLSYPGKKAIPPTGQSAAV